MRTFCTVRYRKCRRTHASVKDLRRPGMCRGGRPFRYREMRAFLAVRCRGMLYPARFAVHPSASRPVRNAHAQRFNKILAFLAVMYRQSRSVQASPWWEPYVLRRTRYAFRMREIRVLMRGRSRSFRENLDSGQQPHEPYVLPQKNRKNARKCGRVGRILPF